MNQTDIVNAAAQAATQAARTSKNLVSRQVDTQSTTLGNSLSQTARDLERIGSDLRSSGTIASAAQLADWAAAYVDRAGTYLMQGDTDRFLSDIETLGRERPWAIAASAAALGFIAARIVKSSGARRYAHAANAAENGDYAFDRSIAANNPVAL